MANEWPQRVALCACLSECGGVSGGPEKGTSSFAGVGGDQIQCGFGSRWILELQQLLSGDPSAMCFPHHQTGKGNLGGSQRWVGEFPQKNVGTF